MCFTSVLSGFLQGGAHYLYEKWADFLMINAGQDSDRVVIWLKCFDRIFIVWFNKLQSIKNYVKIPLWSLHHLASRCWYPCLFTFMYSTEVHNLTWLLIPYAYTKYNRNIWQTILIQRFELFYTKLFICSMVLNDKRTAERLS